MSQKKTLVIARKMLEKINEKIDARIIAGKTYRKESAEHLRIRSLVIKLSK